MMATMKMITIVRPTAGHEKGNRQNGNKRVTLQKQGQLCVAGQQKMTDFLVMRDEKTLEPPDGPLRLRWTLSSPGPALLGDNPTTYVWVRRLAQLLERRVHGCQNSLEYLINFCPTVLLWLLCHYEHKETSEQASF